MIDLNDISFESDIEKIKAIILSKFSEEYIFRHYLGNFTIGKPFLSPFRNDSHPSFSIFIGRDTGALLYHEMLYREVGNCFKFVKNLYGLATYRDAYLKVCVDLEITDISNLKNINTVELKSLKINSTRPSNLKIGVKYRLFNENDKNFWKQFNISKKTLLKYNVKPISHIFYNDYGVLADKLAYAFKEIKDNEVTFKIYQPYNEKYKWSNNHDSSVWQGWSQLSPTHDTLIITSSLKDTMSIHDTLNVPAIALQAETTKPKPHIIAELKSRFKNIYIFYDNDYDKEKNWGQLFASELINEYNLQNISIPCDFLSKDISDMIKRHGTKTVQIWANSILKQKQ